MWIECCTCKPNHCEPVVCIEHFSNHDKFQLLYWDALRDEWRSDDGSRVQIYPDHWVEIPPFYRG